METRMMENKKSEYFPHDCDACDDPKMMIMISQLGLESYGIYWILIEFLRKQKDYSAPILLLDPLSRRYAVSREKMEAIVTKFGLFEVENEMFYSPSLRRRMSPLDDKREHMQQLALKRWNADAMPPQSVRNAYAYANAMQSKSKSKRENKSKSKEEENIKEFVATLPSLFFPAWEKWIAFKKKIGKPYKTADGMRGKYQELYQMSSGDAQMAMDIIDQSIRNEWSGLFPLKSKPTNQTDEDPFDRERRLLREEREKLNARKNGN